MNSVELIVCVCMMLEGFVNMGVVVLFGVIRGEVEGVLIVVFELDIVLWMMLILDLVGVLIVILEIGWSKLLL